MLKFAWANTDLRPEADAVLIGVPDETGSQSHRQGTRFAPDAIRRTSVEREVFEREGIKITALSSLSESSLKLCDFGDVKKDEVCATVAETVNSGSIPIVLGGDHSITAQSLKGFDEACGREVAVLYFDAHPDFICSEESYFGSVVCDISHYRHVKFSKSVEIGIRSPEPEELINLRQENLLTITPSEILEHGVNWVMEELYKRGLEQVYISFDMDVVDPAFAPGVSTPVPGGISSNMALTLVGLIAKNFDVRGIDIMEVCPPYDIQGMTCQLTGRLVMEAIKYGRRL